MKRPLAWPAQAPSDQGKVLESVIECLPDGFNDAEIFIRNEDVPDGRCEYLASVAKDITERLRSERHQVELDAAHAIQRRLYPKEAPQTPGFDIAGTAYPAESLCGDYSDFFPMPGGCLGMTVADVCGHGVGPSIHLYKAASGFRSEGPQLDDMTAIVCKLEGQGRTPSRSLAEGTP